MHDVLGVLRDLVSEVLDEYGMLGEYVAMHRCVHYRSKAMYSANDPVHLMAVYRGQKSCAELDRKSLQAVAFQRPNE